MPPRNQPTKLSLTLKRRALLRNTATSRRKGLRILAAATPQQPKGIEARKAELLRHCAELTVAIDILAEFDVETQRIGLVGEQRIARLLLLAVITRVFSRPVSVVVKGSSSGGKNTVVLKILQFFPKSAFYELTGMSDKALIYFKEPLKHRVLFISELAGLQGTEGQVLLRNLLSEGRLRKEVTCGKTTKLVELEGPTGVIITTTNIKLYHDDETRVFSVEVADTPEQNRAVVMAIAELEATGKADELVLPDERWPALLEWVALGSCRVVVPYVRSIGRLMPVEATRVRRDFKAVVGLIKAHALLHQRTREKDDEGAIIATLADYRAVRAIVKDIMAEGSDAAVSPAVKAIVQGVRDLKAANKKATVAALVDLLILHRSNVNRNAKAAMQGGYLVNIEAGKGRAAEYGLGNPLPLEKNALPTTKAVARDWRMTTGKKS